MTYKLTNELKQLVNNIAVCKYDLIAKMFDCDFGLSNYINTIYVSYKNKTLLCVFYFEEDGNQYYDNIRDDEALKEFSDRIKNDEDVSIDIEIHTMADEITKWYEVVLCKDIQLKFAKDGFIDIYNNNISKYVCIDNEERVQ